MKKEITKFYVKKISKICSCSPLPAISFLHNFVWLNKLNRGYISLVFRVYNPETYEIESIFDRTHAINEEDEATEELFINNNKKNIVANDLINYKDTIPIQSEGKEQEFWEEIKNYDFANDDEWDDFANDENDNIKLSLDEINAAQEFIKQSYDRLGIKFHFNSDKRFPPIMTSNQGNVINI